MSLKLYLYGKMYSVEVRRQIFAGMRYNLVSLRIQFMKTLHFIL